MKYYSTEVRPDTKLITLHRRKENLAGEQYLVCGVDIDGREIRKLPAVVEICPSCSIKEEEDVKLISKEKLRDQFAAAALTGLLSQPTRTADMQKFATEVFAFADAMLQAREAKP